MSEAETKVMQVHSDAFIARRGRVWRVYEEHNVPTLLGSGVSKQAAWETAWKNIPSHLKKQAAHWRRFDRMRARLGRDGWTELLGIMDLRLSVHVYQRDDEFQILTIGGNDETIRRFEERND